MSPANAASCFRGHTLWFVLVPPLLFPLPWVPMKRVISSELIERLAYESGFDFCGVVKAESPPFADTLRNWVKAGYAADMRWFERSLQTRLDPRRILPEAQTVISVGMSYFCEEPDPAVWNDPSRGRLARYTWGPDYHEVMRSRLRALADSLQSVTGRTFRWCACVDSSPILERSLAVTHTGFIGRNAVYIHPTLGLYVVLGELLISEPADKTSNITAFAECHPCAACIETCPTSALVAPYTLDARRCIAYLTVENRGAIPVELRSKIGNWLLGCDECLQICPFAGLSRSGRLVGTWRFDLDRCCPRLEDVLRWSDRDFHIRYRGSVVARLGWRLFLRNALVAAGNSRVSDLAPLVKQFAESTDDVLKSHAEWALAKLQREPDRNKTA